MVKSKFPPDSTPEEIRDHIWRDTIMASEDPPTTRVPKGATNPFASTVRPILSPGVSPRTKISEEEKAGKLNG
jgi:hypothetical protein